MEQQEIREILQRAEEIEAQKSISLIDVSTENQVIEAAVEDGLSREAITQAIQERMSLEMVSRKVGELVFALSADGYCYPARIRSIEGDVIEVTFLNGTEHRLMKHDIQPFSLLPGTTVNAPWAGWGAWNCSVLSYDRDNLRVRLSDRWGSEQNFAVADIRIKPVPETSLLHKSAEQLLYKAGLVASGGVVGALITWLILR